MAALHLSSLTHQSWSQATPITSSLDPVVSRCLIAGTRSPRRIELGSTSFNRLCNGVAESRVIREKVIVKCGVQEANVTENLVGEVTENLVGKVTEVNKDTFWPIVHAAQDKAVVLDMYTQWCGPCKMMAPMYEKLAQEKLDVIFLKLDCNQENKSLAKELGIRVVPTFKILKDSKIVKEVNGAKMDVLIVAIEAARSSS